jgi:hypothetical protein
MAMLRRLFLVVMASCLLVGIACLALSMARLSLPVELWALVQHLPTLGIGYSGQVLCLLLGALVFESLRVLTYGANRGLGGAVGR